MKQKQQKKLKLLIGGIYRPPNFNNSHWDLLEQSIDQAFTALYDNVLVTGDFNINIKGNESNKMSRLIQSYNEKQLISSDTHYTENSSSLIDLIFVKNTSHIIASFVADPFIPDRIRFHCPVVAILKFDKPNPTTFKRRIWLYDKGNYTAFREKLKIEDWSDVIASNNLENFADIISETIIKAAAETIPNKIATIRPTEIPWLNNNIRKLIRKRNRLRIKANTLNKATAWAIFRQFRNQVTKAIQKSKFDHTQKLITQINTNNLTSKSWFKLAKQLTQQNNKSNNIPTLIHNNV